MKLIQLLMGRYKSINMEIRTHKLLSGEELELMYFRATITLHSMGWGLLFYMPLWARIALSQSTLTNAKVPDQVRRVSG